MAQASFFVNDVNEAPGVPGIDRPLDGSAVPDLELAALAPDEPDLDSVRIIFSLELEDGTVINSAAVEPIGGTSSWSPPVDAEDGDAFCWSARAIDEHDLEGLPSETMCFTIESTNLPPSAPDFETPADEPLASLTPEFVVTNGVDPEGRATTTSTAGSMVSSPPSSGR